MMKRIKFAILALALAAPLASAQQARTYMPDEVGISYGRVSLPGIAMTAGAVLGTVFSAGIAEADEFSVSGAISGEYYHWFGPHFSVGGVGVFESATLRFKSYQGKDSDGGKIYEQGDPTHDSFVSLMPAVKWRYLARPAFGMYMKAAAGLAANIQSSVERRTEGSSGEVVTTTTPAEVSAGFAFQLTALGIEFGGARLRGFAELGFGMQGIVLAGMKWGF